MMINKKPSGDLLDDLDEQPKVRTKITRDLVFRAAEALQAEGQKITVKAVIAKTGGSATTVSPFLTDWREAQGQSAPKRIRKEAARPHLATRAVTSYALTDTAFVGLGLFQPLRRGAANRRSTIDIETTFDGEKLRIISAFKLGADDQSVLLALIALAGMGGKRMAPAEKTSHEVQVIDGLESEGSVTKEVHVAVYTTLYQIIREAGLKDTGDAYKRIEECLTRLRGVYYVSHGREGSNQRRFLSGGKQNLIGISGVEGEETTYKVILNARFAKAIFGGAQFTKISLEEQRQLSETARILHARLCVAIREGNHQRVALDTLSEWIYKDPVSAVGMRRRRMDLREALAEIGALDCWEVGEDRRKILTIGRSGRGGKPTPAQGMLPLDME